MKSHRAQIPGRRTGSKKSMTRESPHPRSWTLNTLQYIPWYDWCYDICSQSDVLRIPGAVHRDYGIYMRKVLVFQKRYISPRMKSVNTSPRIHFLILVQDCGVLLGIRHESFSTIYQYCVVEPWFSRRQFLGISALLCPFTTTSYVYSRRVS